MPEDPSNVKAAATRGARIALFTFIATFIPALLGFLAKVTEWASSNGETAFPDASTLVYAVASAVCAAFAGLIGFLWNWLENSKGFAIFGAKTNHMN